MSEPVFFNPFQDGYAADPYPHYAEMREHDPVHLALESQWILFTYDDAFALLRDPNVSADERNDEHPIEAYNESDVGNIERNTSMLGADPPDHTRLRTLVGQAFTPKAVAALRTMIEHKVEVILDGFERRGGGELIDELASALPFHVISEMLGVPEADRSNMAIWSSMMVKTLDPIITDEEIRESAVADAEMRVYLEGLIDRKRAHPGADLLTAMIAAEVDGDRLTKEELRDQVALMFMAGHETTLNLLGVGIFELLRHPDQAALLRDDPTLDLGAVDELLRFVSPVQFTRRITLKPIIVRGTTIPRGVSVMASLASGNRDAAKWGATAEDLDLRRAGAGQHLAFGGGHHYCLGASLTKLEAPAAIGTFVRRFPGARVVGDPVWNGRMNLRGLEHLEIAIR